MWLREYDDLFLYAETLTMERWRAAGIDAALSLRVGSLPAGLAVLGHPLLYYAVPLTLLGLWRTRRAIATWIPLAYVMALYALMTLVFPLQGVRRAVPLLIARPTWLYGWTVQGLETVVARGARRRGWPERRPQAVFCAPWSPLAPLASVYFAGQLTGAGTGAWRPTGRRHVAGRPHPGRWAGDGRRPARLLVRVPAFHGGDAERWAGRPDGGDRRARRGLRPGRAGPPRHTWRRSIAVNRPPQISTSLP